MSWTLEEVKAGQMEVTLPDGALRVYTWEDASHDPGWCKLDWVIADKTRGQLANASNVLDPTWEAPDGTIVPLDGFLDPYYQEVYLESESIPLFSKLVKELSADSVDDYVDTLEHEVWKYTVKEPNYGKAARRMYNVFRMNGKYREAAYIRELFDEPVTALYQVSALIRTLDDAASSGDTFATDTMVSQVDGLIMSAIQALDGPEEAKMVGHLLQPPELAPVARVARRPVRRDGRHPGRRHRRRQHLLREGAALGPGDRGVPRGHRHARALEDTRHATTRASAVVVPVSAMRNSAVRPAHVTTYSPRKPLTATLPASSVTIEVGASHQSPLMRAASAS